jgi:hypothetical protein
MSRRILNKIEKKKQDLLLLEKSLKEAEAELDWQICGNFIKTNIVLLNEEKLCFTHFRNGVGKQIFERGDLFG